MVYSLPSLILGYIPEGIIGSETLKEDNFSNLEMCCLFRTRLYDNYHEVYIVVAIYEFIIV